MDNINIPGEHLKTREESLNDRDVNYKWYMAFNLQVSIGETRFG